MIKRIKNFLFSLTELTKEEIEIKKIQKHRQCKHERWNHDTQIRTIECKTCGLRAWVDDYKNLY
jgi:hypothetical protein